MVSQAVLQYIRLDRVFYPCDSSCTYRVIRARVVQTRSEYEGTPPSPSFALFGIEWVLTCAILKNGIYAQSALSYT